VPGRREILDLSERHAGPCEDVHACSASDASAALQGSASSWSGRSASRSRQAGARHRWC
jgi:hypothetical protein